MKRKVILTALSCIGLAGVAFFYTTPQNMSWNLTLLAIYTALHFWLLYRHIHTLQWSGMKLAASFILSCFWICSSHPVSLGAMNALAWIITATATLMVAFSFYLAISELEHPFKRRGKAPSRWWMVLYAAIPILCWGCYFLAYYPGKMTYDSMWQWDMAHGIRPYNNWHPILHTWLIQATASVYDSPASYTVAQILVLSIVVAYALFVLQSWGAPLWLVIVLDVFYAVNPVNGFFSITMWKDIPFAASILLLTVLLAQVVHTEGSWLQKKRNIAFFVTVCFFAMHLRHNGTAVVLATLLASIFLLRAIRMKMLWISVSVIALHVVFNGPVMNYFHVIPNPLNEALAIPTQQIAATFKYQGKFTPQLKAYYESILPADRWAKDYDPHTVDPVKHDTQYNPTVIDQSLGTYLKHWTELLKLNPGIFVQAYLDQVSVIWQLHSPTPIHPYFDSSMDLQEYPLGMRIMAPQTAWDEPVERMLRDAYDAYVTDVQSVNPGHAIPSYDEYKQNVWQTVQPLQTESKQPVLKAVFDQLFVNIRDQWQDYLLKGAIPLFALLLSLIASVRRSKSKGIVVFLPSLFVVITIAIAMPATDFRYSFGFAFTVPFLLFYGKLSGLKFH
jgi:hypothetical protein